MMKHNQEPYYKAYIPANFEDAIRCIAKNKILNLSYDTHYDAGNFEFNWWTGNILNRLEFQPMEDKNIIVTWYRDIFPYAPKLFRWAWINVPLFPYKAKIEYSVLGGIKNGETKDKYIEQILSYLKKAA